MYAIIVENFIPPGPDVEITLFTLLFQGVAYLVLIGIANILYHIGEISEEMIKPKNIDQFRKWTFNIGFCLSVALPFLIPILLFYTHPEVITLPLPIASLHF